MEAPVCPEKSAWRTPPDSQRPFDRITRKPELLGPC